MLRFSFALVLIVLTTSPAAAQRTVAYDTLAESSRAAITCGFCATEQFGTVFHALPPGPVRGLEPEDFPLRLDAILVAVARGRVAGPSCTGLAAGGTAAFDVRVYAGAVLPDGSIRDLPGDTPWPGETLVHQIDDVDLELSTSDMDGSTSINVMFNMLDIADGVEVPAGNTYLRVVFTIPAGGMGTDCASPPLVPAEAYPVRDDGRIANRRSLIFAVAPDGSPSAPRGWYWNEEAGVAGDWGVRIQITSESTARDAGPADAGPADAGPRDAGRVDGGGGCVVSADCPGGQICEMSRCVPAMTGGGDDGGCCSIAPGAARHGQTLAGLALLALVGVLARRRRL
jgi:MYXO-CTERM domain-containing protein